MSVLEALQARAARRPAHIVLSEGEDARVAAGAAQALEAGTARHITLLGARDAVEAALGQATPQQLTILDPQTAALTGDIAQAWHARRAHRGVDAALAAEQARDPLIFAAMMVSLGHADGTVGGAVATTSDTVRAALQAIGKAPDAGLVSSFFLMVLPEAHPSGRDAMIFSDSGLVIDPSSEELASIAAQSAASCQALLETTPKVAMLSFSTKGSARHAKVTKVVEAAQILTKAQPDLAVDGELQFDAAFVPEVAGAKAPGSPLAGAANVMIFPDLNAGNIGYKIAQRIGGCSAIGPILQGLARPANDLSRGCTAQDVMHMIAVTSLQAAAAEETP